MKKILFTSISIILSIFAYAQGIGIGTLSPHASAQLDITHTSKGILIPRMPTSSVVTIGNPAKGLMIYDSVKNQLLVNMGNAVTPNWQTVVFNSGWSLGGNSGTNPANHFIGTTDLTPLSFKINNVKAGYIDSATSNVSMGFRTLNDATTAIKNVALGYKALTRISTGNQNVAVGSNSLYSSMSGFQNVAIGDSANYSGDGSFNVSIGSRAAKNNTGSWNTIIGFEAGINNQAWGNVFIGSAAGELNSTGSGNSFVGDNAGRYNTFGSGNSFFGSFAGRFNKGTNNAAYGSYALANNPNANYSTAIGASAGSFNNAEHNTFVGNESGYSTISGLKNTAVGSLAFRANNQGSYNTAEGYAAMYLNTTGINNTASGYGALYSNTSGHYNVALGSLALYTTTTSQYNTALGTNAGKNYDNGWNNVFVGANTDVNGAGYFNVVAIGQGTVATASSQVRLGNGATASFFCQGAYASTTASGANVFVNSIGQIMRSTSSARYKTNISNLEINTALLHKLRPVSYNSNTDNQRHFGLIAEEIAEIIPELAEYAKEKDVIPGSTSEKLIPDAVQYPLLSVLVLKEVQKHEQIIKEQQLLIEELRLRLEKLEKKNK